MTQSDPGEEARKRTTRRRRRALDAEASSSGLVFVIAVLLGCWVGGVVGRWFGAPAEGRLIGGALGNVAGFYNLFYLLRRMRDAQGEK